MNSIRVKFLVYVLAALLVPIMGAAQSNRGRISGQVTDPTGATIPGASITIENVDTHVQRVLLSNGEGNYSDPTLEPGFYSVKVEAQRFQNGNT